MANCAGADVEEPPHPVEIMLTMTAKPKERKSFHRRMTMPLLGQRDRTHCRTKSRMALTGFVGTISVDWLMREARDGSIRLTWMSKVGFRYVGFRYLEAGRTWDTRRALGGRGTAELALTIAEDFDAEKAGEHDCGNADPPCRQQRIVTMLLPGGEVDFADRLKAVPFKAILNQSCLSS